MRDAVRGGARVGQIGKTGVVLVVEPLGRKTGLGIRFGTWLLERGLTPKYGYIGVTREGSGGLWEQVYHQVSIPPRPSHSRAAHCRSGGVCCGRSGEGQGRAACAACIAALGGL
jgi:hypothetical protein